MAQGRQAKILTPRQETAILRHLETTRYPERDRSIFLLSIKGGMRAKEISALTWSMVTDGDGKVGELIALENRASKGRSGRPIPMHPLLHEALATLHQERGEKARPERPVVYSERGLGMSAATVRLWFYRLYDTLGMTGCTSHSGRRTFITRAARKGLRSGRQCP